MACNPYHENGYENREEYLASLAENHSLPLETVRLVADLLGPNEDFDGLVIALEDYTE